LAKIGKELSLQEIMINDGKGIKLWTAFDKFNMLQTITIERNCNVDFPMFQFLMSKGIKLDENELNKESKSFYYCQTFDVGVELKGKYNFHDNFNKYRKSIGL
jgi:hypothetical protein